MKIIPSLLLDKIEKHQKFQDLRHQEIQQKKTAINQIALQERAELYGIIRLSTNSIETGFIPKEKLKNITPQDKVNFGKIKIRQARERLFSNKTIQIIEKCDKHDLNSKLVLMGQGAILEVSPDDEITKNILTIGLNGCTATMVFVETKDGKRICVLTHFPPTQVVANSRLLEKLIPNIAPEAIKIARAIILCPGDYHKDKNGNWLLIPKKETDNENTLLESIVQRALAGCALVDCIGYSTQLVVGEKDQGILVVTIPPVGEGDVTYRINSWKDNALTNSVDTDLLQIESEFEELGK
ncbi:MAG: hypothetical protein A2W85_13525 [Bacteroidetes bacterium GWF2_41_31]|nr:MAG: hypothetical protein A2W85_13525 [Bacteroidetes bacterium GWF2_41_31]OFZ10220.1 MAG: hypothetical protein A2338_08550 [Bacteroidetes bacterium RIFOXYB12_FULL_41_6]